VNNFKSVLLMHSSFSYGGYVEPKAGTINFYTKEIYAVVRMDEMRYICTVVYLKNECVLDSTDTDWAMTYLCV